MSSLPFWVKSPSPFTIIIYLVYSLYGTRQLLRWKRQRWKPLVSAIQTWTDALFILGFYVLLGDLVWVIICYLRFATVYTGGTQLLFCALRDVSGLVFCYMRTKPYFHAGIIKVTSQVTVLWYVNIVFMILWFAVAPDPSLTDWTYAIQNGYSLVRVASSFLLSHGVGKALTGLIYLFSWKKWVI